MRFKLSKVHPSDILFGLVILAAVGVVAILWSYWARSGPAIAESWMKLPETSELNERMARSGQWGDGFGSLNAAFGGFALCAALAAFFMQGKTLRDQTRESRVQRFEATYFELLSLLREARSNVRFKISTSAFQIMPTQLKQGFIKESEGGRAFRNAEFEIILQLRTAKNITKETVAATYIKYVHGRYESQFGAYFRIIYTILKFIKEDEGLTKEERIKYGNILRSQLTSYEVALAAFNATMVEANDLDKILTEFRMLKYLPHKRGRRILEELYDPIAFKGRDESDHFGGEFAVGAAVGIGGIIGIVFSTLLIIQLGIAAGGPTAVVLTLVCAALGNNYAIAREGTVG